MSHRIKDRIPVEPRPECDFCTQTADLVVIKSFNRRIKFNCCNECFLSLVGYEVVKRFPVR